MSANTSHSLVPCAPTKNGRSKSMGVHGSKGRVYVHSYDLVSIYGLASLFVQRLLNNIVLQSLKDISLCVPYACIHRYIGRRCVGVCAD